ncbi:barstar family protein [Xanthomonas theicola]|uniref:Barnase inhibitor n=1 Tax=Xanthomonas theicola TaxID=56464 RepID=A0A2S6ZH64_9XANT|nr:barstar family protein [Xanthomonas theicola]PPT91595.1 barnase inhibitor [Xanthomonas theicola]QNH24168.1 barstar family protein [Xanthomonas theicola]
MNTFNFSLNMAEPAASGVYRVANGDLDSIAALGRDAGLRLCRIDLQGCNSKPMLLMRLAAQLDFPIGFGRNWDALMDGLRDLSWLPAKGGYALLLEDAAELQSVAKKDFEVLLEILDDVAKEWAQDGIAFVAFVGLLGGGDHQSEDGDDLAEDDDEAAAR